MTLKTAVLEAVRAVADVPVRVVELDKAFELAWYVGDDVCSTEIPKTLVHDVTERALAEVVKQKLAMRPS